MTKVLHFGVCESLILIVFPFSRKRIRLIRNFFFDDVKILTLLSDSAVLIFSTNFSVSLLALITFCFARISYCVSNF